MAICLFYIHFRAQKEYSLSIESIQQKFWGFVNNLTIEHKKEIDKISKDKSKIEEINSKKTQRILKLENRFNNLETTLIRCHNISHHTRDFVKIIVDDLINKNIDNRDYINGQYANFLPRVVEDLKKIFDLNTGVKCSVAIRLAKKVDNLDGTSGYSIHHLLRNHDSEGKRKKYDNKVNGVSYKQFMEYNFVLDDDFENYFYLNNLRKNKAYACQFIPDHLNYYDAKLTTTIGYRMEPHTSQKMILFGFLDVDCLGGEFDERDHQFLASVADRIFAVLYLKKFFNEMILQPI